MNNHLQLKCILAILAAALTAFQTTATAEDSVGLNTLFERQKASVYLVTQSVLLDSSKITRKDIFEKIERGLGKKLLDEYIPVSNGTGFLVNSDGFLVTAAHVIKPINPDDKYDAARWGFLQFLSTNLAPGYVSKGDLKKACLEYYALVKNAPIIVSVKALTGVESVATIVAQDSGLDLAILKIEPVGAAVPIPVAPTDALKEGESVYSIGYPLQLMMDKFLDDFKPTLSNGIVSAIRKDNWDIQHTASISPGNSGGPLFRADGTLVGVNVGTMPSANAVYFSIASRKIVDWLDSIGKSDIIKVSTALSADNEKTSAKKGI